MRPRPTKPISPSADRPAAFDFEPPNCSRDGTSEASAVTSGALGSCLDIGTPDLPQLRDSRGGHIRESSDERCLCLSRIAAPCGFFARFSRVVAHLAVPQLKFDVRV